MNKKTLKSAEINFLIASKKLIKQAKGFIDKYCDETGYEDLSISKNSRVTNWYKENFKRLSEWKYKAEGYNNYNPIVKVEYKHNGVDLKLQYLINDPFPSISSNGLQLFIIIEKLFFIINEYKHFSWDGYKSFYKNIENYWKELSAFIKPDVYNDLFSIIELANLYKHPTNEKKKTNEKSNATEQVRFFANKVFNIMKKDRLNEIISKLWDYCFSITTIENTDEINEMINNIVKKIESKIKTEDRWSVEEDYE